MTIKDRAIEMLKDMDRKNIKMPVNKLKWSTEPSGGDLKHALAININMATEDRAEVECLVRDYWELDCVLGGTRKPLQVSFDNEPFGDEDEKGLPD